MDGPPAEEATHQLESLVHAISDLRRRVEALERQSFIAPVEAEPLFQAHAPAPLSADLSSGLLAGLGRVLLGIAGAYLLRAITEANLLPHLAGALAGVLYACVWLVVAQRASASSRWAAPLQAAAASAVLGPLLWEATLRFHTLPPSAAAAILAIFMILGQALAWGRGVSSMAGIVTLAGSATALALIVATLDPLPFALALAATAITVEYGACRDRLVATRWIAATPADFCGFLLAYLITRPNGLPEGYAPVPVAVVVLLLWILLAVYLASILFRTLRRERRIGWFEIGQLLVLAAVAIGTVLELAHASVVVAVVGGGCLLFSAGFYAAAGWKRARGPERNAQVYATFGLLLALLGFRLLAVGLTLAALWSVLALVATGLGEHLRRNVLRVHGALYLVAAGTAAGLMSWSPRVSAAALIGMVAASAYLLTLWIRLPGAVRWQDRAPSLISAGLLCWSLVGLATGSATFLHLSMAITGTLRTLVVSAIAIALAWLGSRRALNELVWLLYPWMTFGAAKLLLEDFGKGQSATLFVSLLVYGAALIALPRLLRRAKPAASDLS